VTLAASPTRVLLVDDNAVVRAVLRDMLDDGPAITVIGEVADGPAAVRLAAAQRPEVTLLDHRTPRPDGLAVIAALAQHTRVLLLAGSGSDDAVRAALRAGACGYLIHGRFSPAELHSAVHAAGQRQLTGVPRPARAVPARSGATHTVPAGQAGVTQTVPGGQGGALRAVPGGQAGSTRTVPDGQAGSARTVPDGQPARAARPAIGRPGSVGSDQFGLTRREREIMELIGQGWTNRAIAAHLFLAPKTVQNHINRLFAKLGATNRAAAIRTWRG
jgi:DNA-binding NarL/FixJ family response regulator